MASNDDEVAARLNAEGYEGGFDIRYVEAEGSLPPVGPVPSGKKDCAQRDHDDLPASERDQLMRAVRVAVFDLERGGEYLPTLDAVRLTVLAKAASFIDNQKWQHPSEAINAAVTATWNDVQHDDDIKDAIANITSGG